MTPPGVRSPGRAWIALCVALAAHVVDEALTDFLSVYNPTVRAIRGRIPWLPLPVFTFETWLTGLILMVVLLLAISPLVFRRVRWMKPACYVFAVLMAVNGLMHIVGSIYFGRLMPGVYSAPLLLGASLYLMAATRRSYAPMTAALRSAC